MRKLCPNYDREDALETVLEVPMPEEIFGSTNKSKAWHKPKFRRAKQGTSSAAASIGVRDADVRLLLSVLGAPLIPFPLHLEYGSIKGHAFRKSIRNQPIEGAMAKYIVKQYAAAVGGEKALDSIQSMCATGKVSMSLPEISARDDGKGLKSTRKNTRKARASEALGGFVLLQKGPELWSLELVVSGYKIGAGGDGRVTWRQTPWQHSHSSRGPSRPLRRFLQGLDPKAIATLFENSICLGEKTIDKQDCFILKLEADSSALRARSTKNVEIIRHTVWGCFSQKTGLLVQLEDSYLLRLNSQGTREQSIFWETAMTTHIQDYRTVDGVQIAHLAKTSVSLLRFGESSTGRSRTRMEEVWEIEEIDFNVKGLSRDCFLAPADLTEEDEHDRAQPLARQVRWPGKFRPGSWRISPCKVVAFDVHGQFESDDSNDPEEL